MEENEKNIFTTADNLKTYTQFSGSINTNFQYLQDIIETPKDLPNLKLIKIFSIIALIVEAVFILTFVIKIFDGGIIANTGSQILFIIFATPFVIIAFIFFKKRYSQFMKKPEAYSESSAKKIKKYRKIVKAVFIIFIVCVACAFLYNGFINSGLFDGFDNNFDGFDYDNIGY